jgi:uncharacterized protein
VIAYVDSSVLLRLVLGQADRLTSWERIERGVSSVLAEVECLRTLDRLRVGKGLDDAELASRVEYLHRLLSSLELVELTRPVLARAAQPMPTTLGTLDALHLATALLWRDQWGEELTVATHDRALSIAARAAGFPVVA